MKPGEKEMAKDSRIVYGAGCLWWDSIEKAVVDGVPRCPHCHGVLYECESPQKWFANADKYADEHKGDFPGYSNFIRWLRGRCFATLAEARATWEKGPRRG